MLLSNDKVSLMYGINSPSILLFFPLAEEDHTPELVVGDLEHVISFGFVGFHFILP
jgi:hypothetical protein